MYEYILYILVHGSSKRIQETSMSTAQNYRFILNMKLFVAVTSRPETSVQY